MFFFIKQNSQQSRSFVHYLELLLFSIFRTGNCLILNVLNEFYDVLDGIKLEIIIVNNFKNR